MSEPLEEIQQALFNLPCGVVVASTSAGGEILQVNAAFTAITGYTHEDVPTVGDWLGLAYPDPDYRAMVMGNWERDVSEPGRDVFYRVRCADGRDKELLLRAGGIGTSRMAVAVLDLSEIRAVELELRESEDRFRLFARSVDQVFWIVGLDPTRMEYVSPAFQAIWGRPVAELYEDPNQWSAPIIDEDQPAVQALWSRALEGDTATVQFEYRIRRPDGELRWIEDSGFAVSDEDGRVVRMVGIAKDITLRKQAEEERRALEQRMQSAQKMESLGVLAGGVAHDFNNLLTVVLGNADLALHELPPESSARVNLGNIRRAAHRAADLARQMLAYSGQGQFVLAHLDLHRLVEEFAHLMAATVGRKADLRLETDGEVLPIEGDATQIRQVVMNLITNASDALGDHNGSITITTGTLVCDAEYLTVPLLEDEREPGLYSYVQVVDTGEGMDEETCARIFEPFFTTKFTGRGLGLAAALGIVHGHGGVIKVRSEPGRGTRIRVLFPVVAGDPEEPAEEFDGAGLAAPGSNRAAVLVVDDEQAVLETASQMLQQGGYRVFTAVDGRSALSLYRQHQAEIDLVLLDLAMPRMDGHETLRALQEIDPEVRVLLSSGYGEQEAALGGAAESSAGFLQKPYTVAALLEAVRTVGSDDPA
jgi:two-component system, cell cycle sensor histidine kinase and response regulator CckA